jgi:uncharacterized membrane protein
MHVQLLRGPLGWLIAAWAAIFSSLLLLNHLALRTNAFDLSVFDYALWSTTHGPRLGLVPFYHQSLTSIHLMPTLWLLWPAHILVPSPILLIAVQVLAVASAAVCLAQYASSRVSPLAAFVLVAAFLFSRRSFGATTSVFYIECLEPLLIFGVIWAATHCRRRLYWLFVVLTLGCKEDMAIYVAAYGLLLVTNRDTRRLGWATIAVATVWVAMAVGIVIPWSRTIDGLAATYTFVADRYGEAPFRESVQRLFRLESARRLLSLTLMVGWICWIRPRWLTVAAPGALISLAAKDNTLQSAIVGHYLFPILPFVFLAALDGAAFLQCRSPALLRVWAALLLLGLAVDNPIVVPGYLRSRLRDAHVAAEVRKVLARIPSDASVVAQPQLVPHIKKRTAIACLDRRWFDLVAQADVVVLSALGDQWPLSGSDAHNVVQRLVSDPLYVRQDVGQHVTMFVRQRPAKSVSGNAVLH